MTHELDEARLGKRRSEGNQCVLIYRRYSEQGTEQDGCKVQSDARQLCASRLCGYGGKSAP